MTPPPPGSPDTPDTPDSTGLPPREDAISLLHGLSDADRKTVLEASEVRPFARHEILIPKGDEYQEIYCLLSGSAAVTAEDERLLAVLGPGDTFGEIGFLRHIKRTANVVAQTDGETLVLSAGAFERFIFHEPALAARMLLNLSRELAGRLIFTTEMALL
jgi:CRP-like cAMP-binding protein